MYISIQSLIFLSTSFTVLFSKFFNYVNNKIINSISVDGFNYYILDLKTCHQMFVAILPQVF